MLNKFKLLTISTFYVLVSVGCSSSTNVSKTLSGSGRAVISEGDSAAVELDGEGTKDASLSEAFELALWPLLTEVKCSECHTPSAGTEAATPYISSDDPAQALGEVVNNGKVNFAHPDQSRLVLRLSDDAHYCWTTSCEADAAAMLAAIERWAKVTTDGSVESMIEETTKNITSAKLFGDANEEKNTNWDASSFYVEAEGDLDTTNNISITQNANTQEGTGDKVSNGKFLMRTNGANSSSTIDFTTEVAGEHYIWLRVSAPGDANNLRVVVDQNINKTNNNNNNNNFSVTSDPAWVWVRAKNGKDDIILDLEANTSYSFDLQIRSDDLKIDGIVVTSNPNFAGGTSPNEMVKVLNYNISNLIGGEKATFKIEVEDFDDSSYAFKNPEILTSSSKTISIKGIKVFINGVYEKANATFNLVEKDVTAPGSGVLAGSKMVVLKDTGLSKDKITIKFEEISVK